MITSWLSSLVLLAVLLQPPTAKPVEQKKDAKPAESEGPPQFEISTSDGSTFRVALLDSTVDIVTAYGPLTIPIKDIRKIDIGFRLTDDEQVKLNKALEQFTGPDRKARVAGREGIVAMGERALPSLRRIKKNVTDAEVLAALSDLETALTPKNMKSESLDRDTIATDVSTFTGRITAGELAVLTKPFGQQKLKLTDLIVAKNLTVGTAEDEGDLITLGPNGLLAYMNQSGKILRVRVTGAMGGNIYGTGTYTLDSYLPMAAIHAGVLKQGETGIVKIKIAPPQQQYPGTVQNGVQSVGYGYYQPGSYEVLGKGKDGAGNAGAGANPVMPIQPAVNRAIIINQMRKN